MSHEVSSYNTYDNIDRQSQKGQPATVLTPRSDGTIETATYLGLLPDNRYYVKLNELDESGNNKIRSVSEHTLSDMGQAALAGVLAGSSSTMERFSRMTGGTTEDMHKNIEKDFWEMTDFEKTMLVRAGVELSRMPGYSQTQHDILLSGKDGDRDLATDSVTRNAWEGVVIRERLARMSLESPTTYEAIRDGAVVGFHGTRSIALAGVLTHGALRSARRMQEDSDGSLMASGEHYSSKGRQPRVSFSNLSDVQPPLSYSRAGNNRTYTAADRYEELQKRLETSEESLRKGWLSKEAGDTLVEGHRKSMEELTERPGSLASELLMNDFPVLFGVSDTFVRDAENGPEAAGFGGGTITGQSAQAEFRPLASEVPLNALPVVAVPEDRIDLVKRLFAQYQPGIEVTIVPIEDIARAGGYADLQSVPQ